MYQVALFDKALRKNKKTEWLRSYKFGVKDQIIIQIYK